MVIGHMSMYECCACYSLFMPCYSLLCGRLMKQLDAARQQVATAEQRADAAAAALTSALRMHAGLTSATERA